MKAKELMIGDWVQNPLGYKAQVNNIRWIPKDKCDDFGGYYLIDIARGEGYLARLEEKDIKPIRITEEMLLRWGFKFDGTDAYILEQRRGVRDPSDKPYYLIKVIPPQPDNDDWWSPDDTGFEVDCDKGDMLLAGQKNTYYHVLQHLLRLAELEDVVELKLED